MANSVAWSYDTKECFAVTQQGASEINPKAGFKTCVFGYDRGNVVDNEDSRSGVKKLRKRDFQIGKVDESSCTGIVQDTSCYAGLSVHSSGATFASGGAKDKLHTLDEEYHMKESDTELVYDKEESWSKKERREKAALAMKTEQYTSVETMSVYGFAAIGFGFLAYGAIRFYFGNTKTVYSS